MSEPLSWIRTPYEYRAGESDRCIKACGLARCENGMWSCPLFAVGVDKVSIINERGVMCRLFERREQ